MTDERTWLATVLFLDISKYSLIPVNQELEIKLHFQDLVAGEIGELEDSDTIRLDTGDGMAICYLGDPERMYDVARRLRDRFATLQQGGKFDYKVRLGMNLGPVKIVEDLNHERNCVGAGINDAQRIMSFAAENQLLVSRSYFEMVSKLSANYNDELHHLGLRADKHEQQHDIYELAVDVVRVDGSRGGGRPATSGTDSASSVNTGKFEAGVIERITNELATHIKRHEAERAMQDALVQADDIHALCARLSEAIPSADDRYDFEQYLKYYGYSSYTD